MDSSRRLIIAPPFGAAHLRSEFRGNSSFWSQDRKQDDVADVRRVGEVHEQPVDADADATHGRHAVFHRPQIVFIDAARFFVARGAEPRLSLIHISEPTRLLSISYAVFC